MNGIEFQKSIGFRKRGVHKLQTPPLCVTIVLKVKKKKWGAIDFMGSSRCIDAKPVLCHTCDRCGIHFH